WGRANVVWEPLSATSRHRPPLPCAVWGLEVPSSNLGAPDHQKALVTRGFRLLLSSRPRPIGDHIGTTTSVPSGLRSAGCVADERVERRPGAVQRVREEMPVGGVDLRRAGEAMEPADLGLYGATTGRGRLRPRALAQRGALHLGQLHARRWQAPRG